MFFSTKEQCEAANCKVLVDYNPYYEFAIGLFVVYRIVTEETHEYRGILGSAAKSVAGDILASDPNTVTCVYSDEGGGAGTITHTTKSFGEWTQA